MDAYGRDPPPSAIPIADSTPRRSPPFAHAPFRGRDEYGYDQYPGCGRGEGMIGDDREYSNGDSYIPEETRRPGGGPGPGQGYGGYGNGRGGRGRDIREPDDRYGRRGRRTPPPYSEPRYGGASRRRDSRSPSPSVRHLAGRPRSISRDRRDAYGYHNGDAGGSYAGGRAMDPNELEGLVPFRQFAEWFRFANPELARQDEEDAKTAKPGQAAGMSLRFEQYKKAFSDRQLYALYLAHRSEPWFVERYSAEPAAQEERRRHAVKGRVLASRRFLEQLEKGEWDGIDYTEGAVEIKVDTEMEGGSEEGAASAPSSRPAKRPVDSGTITSQESGFMTIEPEANQIYIKTIGPEFSRKEMEELLSRVEGFQYLAISDPSQRKGFARVGWAQYSDGTDMDQVIRVLDSSSLRNFTFHMTRNTVAFSGRIKYTPNACNTVARLVHDAAQAKAMALKLEADAEASEPADPGSEEAQSAPAASAGSRHVQHRIEEVQRMCGLDKEVGELDIDQSREKARIELDLWIAYLRNGLNTCYYCVAPCYYQEELIRRCIRHVRHSGVPEAEQAPAAGADGEDVKMNGAEEAPQGARAESFAAKFWKEVDDKVASVLSPESVDPTAYGGRSHEEEVKKVCQGQIKQEEEGKFRCRTCLKLFKGPEFLYKHIPTKHPELFTEMEANLPTYNNFAMDPQRLHPLREQPASVNDKAPLTVFPAATSTPSREYRPSPRNGGGGGGNGYRGRAPLSDRIGGYSHPRRDSFRASRAEIVVPPPPPGAEDPRASKMRVDYKDLDAVPAGDVGGLPY